MFIRMNEECMRMPTHCLVQEGSCGMIRIKGLFIKKKKRKLCLSIVRVYGKSKWINDASFHFPRI